MKTVTGVFGGLLVLLSAVTAIAEPTLIALDAAETRLELLSQDDFSLHFKLDLSTLTAETVSTPAGEFTRLLIPGGHSSQAEGAPLLPMVNRLVEIPYGAAVSIEILATQSREIDLGALGFHAPLIPMQPSLPKNVSPSAWPFVQDAEAYRADRTPRMKAR